MKIRMLATAALLSAGLSGCTLAPYALSAASWSPQESGMAYYQPAPTYWVTPSYNVWQAPQPQSYYRPVDVRRPHRDHDQDRWSEHHFAGR